MSGLDKTEYYIEADLTVDRQIHEAVCNFIIERFAGGLILEDVKSADTIGIKFYIPEGKFPDYKDKITTYINDGCGDEDFRENQISSKTIRSVEWVQAYRDSVKAIGIGNLFIRPPWIEPSREHEIDLLIEPRMAFGTGNHETTQLCVKEILKHLKPGDSFFDLGCGSGILSILAARIGGERVKGVDIDSIAVQNSMENIALNGVEKIVKIARGSIELAKDEIAYDMLAANIIRSTILELYDRIHDAVGPGGIIILSGLMRQDEDEIVEMLSKYDIRRHEVNRAGQWTAVTVFKK